MKRLFVTFVVCITLLSCETRIPEVDTTVPTFSFDIRGDGFNRVFTQDDDFSRMQLNLKANTEYRFIYSGADQGGVGLIQWQLGGSDQIEFVSPELPFDSWSIRDISVSNRMIEWFGERTNPKTGAILSGRFRTGVVPPGNSGNSGTLSFFVRDFGGQSGTSNRIRGNLNILIHNSETELSEF
ncbi:hypothetical protein [Psychroserpens mesophilus]|uniref:hypothetical protein n=1 Tax=Psychroserpens mesophilus TaxID=325473 RepID=UPI003D64D3B2